MNRGKNNREISLYSVGSHDTTKNKTNRRKRKWQKYFKAQH